MCQLWTWSHLKTTTTMGAHRWNECGRWVLKWELHRWQTRNEPVPDRGTKNGPEFLKKSERGITYSWAFRSVEMFSPKVFHSLQLSGVKLSHCWWHSHPMLQIHYWERDKQNQSEKVKVIFVPDTRVHLTNLTSYTPYLVTLTAFNTAGDGPPSDPRGARTLQSGRKFSIILLYTFSFSFITLITFATSSFWITAPSQPSYLSFSEVTGGSVNVSWGAPLTPNGQLEGYRVIYQPTAPVQGAYSLHTHTHWKLTGI